MTLTQEANNRIVLTLSNEIHAKDTQVEAAVNLLDTGATVPFIARYRKEVTGGLDDSQLRLLQERLVYLRDMEERRAVVMESIAAQGKLTEELKQALLQAETKQRIEDLYLPYKPKRRTRAQIAKEAGLEPLANSLFENPTLTPETEAARFLNEEKGIKSIKDALNGARDILAERFSEDAELLAQLRSFLTKHGFVVSELIEGKETEGAKFKDYFDFDEELTAIPSHRALALFRGRQEGVLSVKIALSEEEEAQKPHPCQSLIAEYFGIKDLGRAADSWLQEVCRWTWRVKVNLTLETELFESIRERAEEEAIRVFGINLKDLLLAAPAGQKGVIGLDPGLRTGVKVAVISATGSVLETGVIYPHEPRKEWDRSIEILAALAKRHGSKLISIGNGTASRETDRLAADLIARYPELGLIKVVVSEAGASVYSASELAAKEFPDMDVSYRGAVSIARRLQDPLAELVKIDPKAIGVGQYQHDVNQIHLAQKLDAVVEDCVNAVGVDLNTASVPLLARVSGLTKTVAQSIVMYRDAHGAFKNRKDLMNVPRLGEKTFEQAAGFLRISGGDNPLDTSAVHPEAYPVVEKILAKTGCDISTLIGNHEVLKGLKASEFTDDRFGIPTVKDILSELEKPGRDPRPEFKTAVFREGVETIADLRVNMELEGVVSNVAAFGAFVDIGVHQDGLVHVSELADHFVKDPREVVKVGQIVKVRVIDVDIARNRISLSMKSGKPKDYRVKPTQSLPQRNKPMGAMASAFAKLKR